MAVLEYIVNIMLMREVTEYQRLVYYMSRVMSDTEIGYNQDKLLMVALIMES